MGNFLNLNKGLPDSYYNTFNNLNHVSPAQLPYTIPQLNTNLPQKLNIDFNNQKANSTKKSNLTGSILAQTGQVATDYLSDVVTKGLDDSEFGRALGNIFSSGINSAGNTIIDNIIKGQSLTTGLGKNVGTSVAGTGAGLASNLIGQGITSLGGDSRLSKGIGQGVATGLGTVGGTILSNLIQFGNIAGKADKLFGTMDAATKAAKIAKLTANGKSAEEAASIVGKSGAINPYGLAASVAGMALGAATGPSKEYGGRYGNITKYMDLGYDALATGINFVPGWGQLASGLMQLNKGLSNVFGSTDGMTIQDAILGSAFMPAPVKWLNMAGAKTTDDFYRQSFQNQQKATAFMQNGFGNLNQRFDQAREESGKTYGTFSRGAYRKAQNNIDFANNAWGTIMDMADQNELQKVRSQYMTTINDQRYAQMIGGGYNPIYIGKQGMKILNNATNHNIAMRLLSAAALIDNKQMILCSVTD